MSVNAKTASTHANVDLACYERIEDIVQAYAAGGLATNAASPNSDLLDDCVDQGSPRE
jgi:hypothetical protein